MITRAQARALGLSDQAVDLRRRQGWAAPIRGAMVVPPVRGLARAHARAALLVAGGAVCGPTAARLHNLPGLPRRAPDETGGSRDSRHGRQASAQRLSSASDSPPPCGTGAAPGG